MILRSKSCSLPVLTCQYPSEVARLSPSFHPPSWMVIVVPRLGWAPMFDSGRRGSVYQNSSRSSPEVVRNCHVGSTGHPWRVKSVWPQTENTNDLRGNFKRAKLDMDRHPSQMIQGSSFLSFPVHTLAFKHLHRSDRRADISGLLVKGQHFDNTLRSIVFTTRFVFQAHAQISIKLSYGIL